MLEILGLAWKVGSCPDSLYLSQKFKNTIFLYPVQPMLGGYRYLVFSPTTSGAVEVFSQSFHVISFHLHLSESAIPAGLGGLQRDISVGE
ncbi:hypothetical protein EVAR_20282_1 [Eumeta japonica]|uniref:Uncharacterized protein n=1 Tax=Eumeta variegata TaxID=151549 RepID=A0A4C1VN85_EUMVA|nr:hypothetical protein EVAR_20282_1 [Eumeta japonica]